MDERDILPEEKMPVAAPIAVPIPEAPKEDTMVPPPVSAPVAAALPDQSLVQAADVWTNGEYSFRVDQITPIGSVRIRFRTDANLDPKPLSPNPFLKPAPAARRTWARSWPCSSPRSPAALIWGRCRGW